MGNFEQQEQQQQQLVHSLTCEQSSSQLLHRVLDVPVGGMDKVSEESSNSAGDGI